MLVSGIDPPEPFLSALTTGSVHSVGDVNVATALERFGRALARVAAGREDEARDDFVRAKAELGDVCRIELALLDIRQRRSIGNAQVVAGEIAERTESPSRLAARAWHVLGLAEGKLRNHAAATDALLRAAEMYRKLDIRLGRAHVFDTLGALEAARGRLDFALGRYAVSLVDKTLLNDRLGIALTLGSIGRVHLRAGRFGDAVDCFERDLEISTELGDERGIVRMHADLGQAYLELENYEAANREFDECLSLATRHGMSDMAFFARKEMTRLRIRQKDFTGAADELDLAYDLLPEQGEPYLAHLLSSVKGELLLAQGESSAIDLLQTAAEGFRKAQLPDFEIPARVLLARAFLKDKCKRLAEQCLLRGLRLARSDGYSRYLPLLNEAMTELDLVEGAVEETSREIATDDNVTNDAYVIREKLGEGAFGAVYRVYDATRGRDVALKRLRMDSLYDVRRRKRVIDSIRLELEAASRVRHPGISRVLAIGQEPEGGFYVVQEIVSGKSLRQQLPTADANPANVLSQVAKIADALQALHEADVVHRDIKPENIMIRPNGDPVLIDFGIAWMPDRPKFKNHEVAGTLEYMAPEQALGRRLDRRADLYALGVIAFEWLCGVRPIRPHGKTFKQMAEDIATRHAPSVAEFRPDVSSEIADLVDQMLAKKPRGRPKSAAVVADRCGEILAR